ncbi:ATP-binding protein [Thiomicrorhabdus sp.]|uniref:ATP-binding protein n=1 Tax=Thiomicrorhabdus sp. TaxID=2039724 RepID=UPI0029C8D623|nr:ATP-binding protein [Thiomicrorhabdus sp.]
MNTFVAGTYGVGKTSLCKQLALSTGLEHYSASSLVQHTGPNKSVINSENNQEILIQKVVDLNRKWKSLILDGHFCIFEGQEIVKISLEVFNKLNINKVIIIQDEPSKIYLRLSKRAGQQFDLKTITKLQQLELERAQNFCEKYCATLLIENMSNIRLETLKNFIINTK